ncbi:hypothetical protein ON010_g2816 [Phytophthora cinnamomi]|nr:hypothetical protein ON010_g2816 [Phytophthora cinnamomi]
MSLSSEAVGRVTSTPNNDLPRTPDNQKPVPKAVAAFFIAFSMTVWVLTFQAIADYRFTHILSVLYVPTVEGTKMVYDVSSSSHVEEKHGSQNLLTLPEELFINMPRISTIQFGGHERLVVLPPLQCVSNLQSVTLAWTSLRELPPLDNVPRPNCLIIAIMPLFEKMPDMTAQQNPVEPNHICCNDFSGACNLNHSICTKNSIVGVSAPTCLREEPFLGKPRHSSCG